MSKKIAIVSGSCPPVSVGGVASSHYHLYRALKRKGFHVRIYTFEDYKAALHEADITRVGIPPAAVAVLRRVLELYFRIVDPSKIAYDLADVAVSAWPCRMLNSAIMQFQPDVLILPDHGCPGLFIDKPKGCRTILISHHNPMRFLNNPLWGLHSERDARLTVACENRVLRSVDAVVCPSLYMREMFGKTYRYSGPVTVIPNMVDAELIASIPAQNIRSKLSLPEDAVVIYIPSAGSQYKGARFVPEIVRRLASYTTKDVGFYLSGNIPLTLAYELQCASPNAKVYAPGQVGYIDNLSVVKACSFGISPTLIESFGMALLESSFCGVPMISFDVGGNADIVINGRNGMLVPLLDIEALIGGACRLFNESYRAVLRREIALSVADKFRADVIVEKYLALMS